mmetsp:Transcript_142982/g.249341  ORF Transcript_142982/g.249341 Transcript_142982/m.249341 type:complete len:200 (+) Transcript_142982:278-877(+)
MLLTLFVVLLRFHLCHVFRLGFLIQLCHVHIRFVVLRSGLLCCSCFSLEGQEVTLDYLEHSKNSRRAACGTLVFIHLGHLPRLLLDEASVEAVQNIQCLFHSRRSLLSFCNCLGVLKIFLLAQLCFLCHRGCQIGHRLIQVGDFLVQMLNLTFQLFELRSELRHLQRPGIPLFFVSLQLLLAQFFVRSLRGCLLFQFLH